jgi:release factor glutamine methyltransferase
MLITRFRELWLVSPPGVFAPRSDAGMLIDAARERIYGDVLDLCAGTGVLALSAVPHARRVTAADTSRMAVTTARLNAWVNRRPVEVRRGDLFAAVGGRRFDVILSNPPYLPTPAGHPSPIGAAAWEGGHDGRRLVDRICHQAGDYLRPGGELLLVHSSLCGIEKSVAQLAGCGLETEVVAIWEGPLGPLARARLGHLNRLGALESGGSTERIAVISGRRPAGRTA